MGNLMRRLREVISRILSLPRRVWAAIAWPNIGNHIILVLAACIGVYRFLGVTPDGTLHTEDIFKDVAHIFVGFCFGGAYFARSKFALLLGIAMAILETVAFFWGKQ